MTKVNIYLTFNGNCEEAFNFYKEVFGGEFQFIGRYSEMPPDPNFQINENEKDFIMHVSLPISGETVLMGSDSSESFGKATTIGDNFSISVHASTTDECDRLFADLSEGGTVRTPMQNTFWGSYFGQFVDKFGINWMINCELEEHKDFEQQHQANV